MPDPSVRNTRRIVRPDEIDPGLTAAESLLAFAAGRRFRTIYADPPWRFTNRTGKMAPEHKRLSRYATMTLDDILEMPVAQVAAEKSHLYLWCPNALLAEGLEVMKRWGFTYKSNLVWFENSQGRWPRRSRRRFLLSKRDGIGALWN